MPTKQFETPYPVIDADPHFSRVIRYMRPNDYALWAGAAVTGPAVLTIWDRIDPSKANAGVRPAVRLTGFLGVCAGFLLAYQQSSCKWRLEFGRGVEEQGL